MAGPSFEERVRLIIQKDSRYHADGYQFVSESLACAQLLADGRHVSAQELLDGFRQYALKTFGPAARRNLGEWGLLSSRDVGEIVRNLVAAGYMRQSPEDRLKDFESGYDFAQAFPDAKASSTFVAVLYHLVFEHDQLHDLSSHLSRSGGIDPEWVASLRLDPFIENCEPTLDQVGTFHILLEDVGTASAEARFDSVMEMCERFARRAVEWRPKADFLIHDFLVLVEPYCPDLIELVLKRFHLTPNAPPEFGEMESHLLSGRSAEHPRGQPVEQVEEDIEAPEADLTGNFYFGEAPPVSMDVRVYIDRKWVDYLEASRGMRREELAALVRGRAIVNASLNGRSVKRVAFVQKRYHMNVCLFTT